MWIITYFRIESSFIHWVCVYDCGNCLVKILLGVFAFYLPELDSFTWQCWCLPFFLEVIERLWLYSVLPCVWWTSFIEHFLLCFVVQLPVCWEITVAPLRWQQNRSLVTEPVGVTKWRIVQCVDCRRQRHPEQQYLHGTSAAAKYLFRLCLAAPSFCCSPDRFASLGWRQSDGCVIEFGVFELTGDWGIPCILCTAQSGSELGKEDVLYCCIFCCLLMLLSHRWLSKVSFHLHALIKVFAWVDKICENLVEKQKCPAVTQSVVKRDQMSFPLCNKVLLNSLYACCNESC